MQQNEVLKPLFKDYEIIKTLTGGMMNNSTLFKANDKLYVLYIPTKQANEMVDRALEAHSQQIVIGLGITSSNYYFNIEKGIKINEYIEGSSLNYVDKFNYEKIAKMLKILHKGNLTTQDYNPFERLKTIEAERSKLYKVEDEDYKTLIDLIYSSIHFLKDENIVLSHNDFQRSNIIQDLNDEYFVIDFEFMANNYETYDIACFANDRINDGLELLKIYKGKNITKEDYKRFYLWRIFISLQWFNVAIIKHFRGEGKTHNINFLNVATHFLNNAKECHKNMEM